MLSKLGSRVPLLIPFFALFTPVVVSATEGNAVEDAVFNLPIWSVLPFVGLLLSIALFPLLKPHWWEKNLPKVSFFWILVFFIPFMIGVGAPRAVEEAVEMILLDYLPFIVLLWGLFAVTGGIALKGYLRGTPKTNLILIAIGTLLASWIGTTGASMLMIRPVIKANAWRRRKAHVIVFFIFLVSNVGGCLTPLGDPPLYLGFLRGVPFFWTLKLAPLFLLNAVILLAAFCGLDRFCYKRDTAEEKRSSDRRLNAHTPKVPERRSSEVRRANDMFAKEPLRAEGLHNLVFLALIVGSVILNGTLSRHPLFADADGALYGIPILGVTLPFTSIIQMAMIAVAGILSVATTKKELRAYNAFTWGPIKEVATLFVAIFVTMIPALSILNTRGAELGLSEPWQFFWMSGALSSFLDNAPTYVVFMTAAGALGAAEGVVTSVGTVAVPLLTAVSAGAVFMGANTYVGNAPNFMVRSIAEENRVKMPSFFGYMGWSICCLIPVFVIDTFVFFR